jgi:ketosteroid isomerase-like protein
MYAAFNARDIDVLLEQMTPDVDWPNAWEGGRVHGHEEVRDYRTRQWSAIEATVEPVAVNVRPDGRVAVAVDQVVRLRRSCAGGGTRRPRLHLPRRTDRQDDVEESARD